MGTSYQQFQKEIINLSKYPNSKNIVIKRKFKNQNRPNPSFKVIYKILFFYKNISLYQLINSILNKLIIASTV